MLPARSNVESTGEPTVSTESLASLPGGVEHGVWNASVQVYDFFIQQYVIIFTHILNKHLI